MVPHGKDKMGLGIRRTIMRQCLSMTLGKGGPLVFDYIKRIYPTEITIKIRKDNNGLKK